MKEIGEFTFFILLLLTAALTQSTARDGAGDGSLASTSQSTAPATYLVATITPVHKPDATLDETRAFVHARILAARAARSQSLVPASSPHESTGSPHDVPALSPQESTGSPQDVPASSPRESTGSPVLTNRYTPPEAISTQADDDLTSSHSPPTVYVPPPYLRAHYQNAPPSRSKTLKKWSKGLIGKYSSYFRRNECPAGSTSPNDDSVAVDNPEDKDDDDDDFVKISLDKLKKD